MKLYNRILAIIYFILAVVWFVYGFFFVFLKFKHLQIPTIVVAGILGGLLIFLFGAIHWKVSNNILGILRERFLVACSSINLLLVFLCILIIGLIKGESGMIILPALFFLAISSFFTILFGIASVFKINKRILFWVMFSVIVSGIFLQIMNSIWWS